MVSNLIFEIQPDVLYDQLRQSYADIHGVASTMLLANKVSIFVCFIPFWVDAVSGNISWVRDGSGTDGAQRRK